MNKFITVFGILIIIIGVGFAVFSPNMFNDFTGRLTGGGKDVTFSVRVDRGTLADPNIAGVSVNALAISSATLDTKVVIDVAGKTLETNLWQSQPYTSSAGTVTASTWLKYGTYPVTFTSWNKGGELCIPGLNLGPFGNIGGCEWTRDDMITRTLTVSESGATLG